MKARSRWALRVGADQEWRLGSQKLDRYRHFVLLQDHKQSGTHGKSRTLTFTGWSQKGQSRAKGGRSLASLPQRRPEPVLKPE